MGTDTASLHPVSELFAVGVNQSDNCTFSCDSVLFVTDDEDVAAYLALALQAAIDLYGQTWEKSIFEEMGLRYEIEYSGDTAFYRLIPALLTKSP